MTEGEPQEPEIRDITAGLASADEALRAGSQPRDYRGRYTWGKRNGALPPRPYAPTKVVESRFRDMENGGDPLLRRDMRLTRAQWAWLSQRHKKGSSAALRMLITTLMEGPMPESEREERRKASRLKVRAERLREQTGCQPMLCPRCHKIIQQRSEHGRMGASVTNKKIPTREWLRKQAEAGRRTAILINERRRAEREAAARAAQQQPSEGGAAPESAG